jgi:exosortase/archaeosortase family protein
LTLTFLSLVYGYFFEKRKWIRAALLGAIIPVAIVANGSRVTITGILYGINPAYAEGFFHEATGLFLFMADFVILLLLHRILVKIAGFWETRKVAA